MQLMCPASPPAPAVQPPSTSSRRSYPWWTPSSMPLATNVFVGLEAVDQRGRDEPGAATAQVLEGQTLERHALGHALEGERLHDQLGGSDLVEAAVEAVLIVAADVQVAVRATGPAVPVIDAHREVAWSEPVHDQLGVGVGPEDLGRRCVELPAMRTRGTWASASMVVSWWWMVLMGCLQWRVGRVRCRRAVV